MKLRTLFFVMSLVACEGMIGGKPTKMSAGELYESGEPKYDAFLKKVHDEQVAAANWAEESKTARKPLTTALNLPPTASNSAILDAARAAKEKGSGNAARSAAEETAALEKAFAEKQRTNAARLDALATEGADLRKQAVEDRRNMAADKADPAKVDKREEIKREVGAAAEIAANLRDDARHGITEVERLIEGLRKELGIVGDGSGVPGTAKSDEPKKDEPKKNEKGDAKKPDAKKEEPKKPAAKKPESKPAEEKPAPAKKPPAEKPSENEVFNP